jgi:hypothetical protein
MFVDKKSEIVLTSMLIWCKTILKLCWYECKIALKLCWYKIIIPLKCMLILK